MAGEKVLFVLDVEKIQDYIFSTNKLKTIIGASRLLDELNASPKGNTIKFLSDPTYGLVESASDDVKASPGFILSGGGNTKVIFESHDGKTSLDLAMDFEARITAEYLKYGISVVTHIEPLSPEDKTGKTTLEKAEKAVPLKKYEKSYCEALAASPYFKLCETCGKDYGEHIYPLEADKHIVCQACKEKFDYCSSDFRLLPGFGFQTDVEKMHLPNRMIAIVLMDGNNMATKIKALSSLEDLKNFSQKTEEINSDSFKQAIESCFGNGSGNPAPRQLDSIRPIIMGGDDICFIISANKAIPFVQHLTKLINDKSIGRQDLFGATGITLSCGILFAHANFPFNFGYRIADSLLRSAKRFSRKNRDCSAIDFHVLLSSAGDEIEVTRLREYTYEPDVVLTRKPYKHDDIIGLLYDTDKMKKAIAASKLKGLRQILRLGVEKSMTELSRMLSRLPVDKRNAFMEVLNKHGWKRGDDYKWRTSLLDMVEICDFV